MNIVNQPTRVTTSRPVEQYHQGVNTQDGAGVNLTRLLTQPLQQRLDPYLMLDNFNSDDPNDYIAGFPDHPHRGFETITYMINGRMRHKDSAGNEGLLDNGGVQWMTAASGVIHSEIPEQEDGMMEGFQLWLNLPAKDKMNAPWYQDFQADDLPKYQTPDGVKVTVIAGHSNGVDGAVTREITEPMYLDIHLPAGAQFSQPIPKHHNAFVVVYRGSVEIGDSNIASHTLAILENNADSDGVILQAGDSKEAKAILVTGAPLNEPIVQYGPFVMNSKEDIIQAVQDFQDGRFAQGN